MQGKRIVCAGTLIAVSSLAAPAVGVGQAEAAFPGTNGKIVFASDRDGAEDVYIMTADGLSQRRLTNTDGGDQYPVWSPDGNSIVFTSQRDDFGTNQIFRMNPDGTGQTRILDGTFQDLEPAWSRNQGRIAFRSDRQNGTQIWTMNSNGGDLRRLTDVGENINPVWSPTADTIAFSSDRDGDFELYTMDADGGNVSRLTNNSRFDSNPDWSPDGTKIAFQSNRDDDGDGIPESDFDVWVMNSDGTGLSQLTDDPSFDSAPVWSPDGAMVAFQSNRDGDFEIFTMTASGGGVTQLTHNLTATDRVVDWRPLFPGADNTAPVLTLPVDLTVEATSPAGAAVSFTVTVTDAADPRATVDCSRASGDTFTVGTTTVSCTALDASGNWTDGTFNVTVLPNTEAGVDITVSPADATTGGHPITIRFNEVSAEGVTTLETSTSGPPPPAGFRVDGVFYELATTAQFDFAEVCFSHSLDPPPTVGHFANGGWTEPLVLRVSASDVCVFVTSFSPFALLVPLDESADTLAPSVICGSPDGAWHGANRTIACTATDDGSGLADAADAAFTLATSVADGVEDGNASTRTREVCDVAGNCVIAGPIEANKIDRKAPTLVLPASKSFDAISPVGATVTFAALASDGADPNPSVSCAPASGSVFAIGTVTVACTATDHVGNHATGSFSVTVLGAKEQLTRLVQDVIAASKLPAAVKAQLLAILQPVLANFDPSNAAQRKVACTALRAFTTVVQLLSGRGVPTGQAAAWTADANRIRAVLGC